MPTYMDRGGDSGVAAYEVGHDFIDVIFKDGATYRYTVASAGAQNIAAMKECAESGDGLNAYINKYVKKGYAYKLR